MNIISKVDGILNSVPDEGQVIDKGEVLYQVEIMKSIYDILAQERVEVDMVLIREGALLHKGDVVMTVESI